MLVPAWNAALTIRRTLASILDQRDVTLECIVIDDGSSDGTADLVAAAAVDDPRIVLIRRTSNGGVSAARNDGQAVARGDWLMFVDADDRLLPGAIAAMVRPMTDPTVRAVIGQRIWTDGERSWVTAAYDIPDIREAGRKSIATHPGLLYYAALTGKAFHTSLVSDLTFRGRVLGDQPWTIRALLRARDDIVVIPETVYEWTRPAPGSTVQTITSGKRVSALRATEAVTVAIGAYQEIATEADSCLPDPEIRRRVMHAYFERLVRSDFTGPVRDTVSRRDPATDQLYRALGRFLAVIPPASLASSDALREKILKPPLHHWGTLDGAAREAYWEMLHAGQGAAQGAAQWAGQAKPAPVSPRRLARLAIWLAARTTGPTRARLVWLPLAILGIAGRIKSGFRRRVATRR